MIKSTYRPTHIMAFVSISTVIKITIYSYYGESGVIFPTDNTGCIVWFAGKWTNTVDWF